jgi:type IV fimbrial biogenesis protein FimT
VQRRALPSQRGVTLIELAVTLTVMAALMMAAAPSVAEWIRNTRIRSTATSIQAGLMKARNEALRRNTAVVFSLVSLNDRNVMDNSCATSARGTAWVVSLDAPDTKCASDAADTLSVSDDNWAAPRIIEKQSGAAAGSTAAVTAVVSATDSTAVGSVTFNGFGRVAGASPIGLIDVKDGSDSAGRTYRNLRILLTPGGSVRMCDPQVSSSADPRKC